MGTALEGGLARDAVAGPSGSAGSDAGGEGRVAAAHASAPGASDGAFAAGASCACDGTSAVSAYPPAPRAGKPAPELWLVVPCYNEQEVLPLTAHVLAQKLCALMDAGAIASSSHVLLVDDGSSDETLDIIQGLNAHPDAYGVEAVPGLFRGISLAHNAGHQHALYAGLMHAYEQGCSCAVSLDADLQDDPDAIAEMLAAHAAGAEVVFGVRNNRDTDTAFKRGSAEAFYRLMRWLGVELVPDCADFRLMGRRALEALSHYGEANLFLRGLVPALGFETAKVYYRRAARAAGESKYPLGKMLSFALEGITSFSVRPLRLVTAAGLAFLLVSLAMVLYALVSAAMGAVVAGWTSLMVSVWFVGGVTVTSLGIVGEYVGRIYLESKHRPRYIIESVIE